MDKPWFKLNPNNPNDKWWLYSSIRDTKAYLKNKNYSDIVCYLIICDADTSGIFYRVSTWYKDDPNRYIHIKKSYEFAFDKPLSEMVQGEIVQEFYRKFKVYDCEFCNEYQKDHCKILEAMGDIDDIYLI